MTLRRQDLAGQGEELKTLSQRGGSQNWRYFLRIYRGYIGIYIYRKFKDEGIPKLEVPFWVFIGITRDYIIWGYIGFR